MMHVRAEWGHADAGNFVRGRQGGARGRRPCLVTLRESARGSFRIGVRMTITGPNELSGPNDHVLLECMCIFSQFSEFRISAFRKCSSFQYVYFQSDLIF